MVIKKVQMKIILSYLALVNIVGLVTSVSMAPRRHALVVRVVACEAIGPGFDSCLNQMVFLLSPWV